jgi:outer membrane protein OmpA-like peptidoglycan-associated protein
MRRFSVVIMSILVVVAFSGCATRKYVKHEVGNMEPQIAEVRDAQWEQAERIDAVDHRAQRAYNAAVVAGMAADAADANAIAAERRAADADRHAEAAQQTARRALNRVDTVESQIENRIANLDKYTLVDRTTVTFKFDSDVLTEEAMGGLDAVAGQVFEKGYVIELQGFTDSIGSDKYNLDLSQRRADSVLRYLVSKNIPLYRISIVGLGKTNPVADNKTTVGRELNRRVEVRVLRSGDEVATANR